MPGAGAPPGPPPGGPPPAPHNVGPAAAPQGHAGSGAAAVSKIRTALAMLQEALPTIPMGSAAHTAVLNAVKNISAHVEEMGGPQNQGMDMQSLMQLMKQQQQQAPMQALMRMYPGQQGGAPAMPGQPPGGMPQGIPGGGLPPGMGG